MITAYAQLKQHLKPISYQRKFALYFTFHPMRLGLHFLALALQILGLTTGELVKAGFAADVWWTFGRGVIYLFVIYLIQPYFLRFAAVKRIPFVWTLIIQYLVFLTVYMLATNSFISLYNDTPWMIRMMQEMVFAIPFIIAFSGFFGRSAALALFEDANLYPTWTRLSLIKKSVTPLPKDIRFMRSKTPNTEIITSKSSLTVSMNLSVCEDLQPEDLGLRVHRSYWVSKSEIAELKYFGGNPHVILSKGEVIPCSRKIIGKIKIYLATQGISDPYMDVVSDETKTHS